MPITKSRTKSRTKSNTTKRSVKRSVKRSTKRTVKRTTKKSTPKVRKEVLPPYLQKKYEHLKRTEKSKRAQASPFRGWSLLSPKKGTERHLMKSHCGAKCFLDPETEGFPICPYDRVANKPICNIDRAGVLSAYIRARQWKHPIIEKKAKEILG